MTDTVEAAHIYFLSPPQKKSYMTVIIDEIVEGFL